MMADGAARLVAGVQAFGARWVENAVRRIVDAYGRLDSAARAETLDAAAIAGEQAAARVAGELRSLFALAPADQHATPLEIMRSLRQEATEVLAAAGIPPVARDEFEDRSFPDDVYGIVLRSPTELGDDELGGALLAWGLGKAQILRDRRDGDGSS